jgi:D-alanyl-D-alanine carboxypeptidase
MSARFASPKGVFYRLSVRGFASDRDARLTCESLRRQGGSCFVRNAAGDTPVQYASR